MEDEANGVIHARTGWSAHQWRGYSKFRPNPHSQNELLLREAMDKKSYRNRKRKKKLEVEAKRQRYNEDEDDESPVEID